MCDLGIVSNCRNNADFSILVKKVQALTFITLKRIDLTIESLSDKSLSTPDDL